MSPSGVIFFYETLPIGWNPPHNPRGNMVKGLLPLSQPLPLAAENQGTQSTEQDMHSTRLGCGFRGGLAAHFVGVPT